MAYSWFRFYTETIHDRRIARLTDADFRLWVNSLCCARQTNGVIPSIDELAFQVRMPEAAVQEGMARLISAGLFTELPTGFQPVDWDRLQYNSDVSTVRVRRWREGKREEMKRDETLHETLQKQNETLHETAPDTDTDTDTDAETEMRAREARRPNPRGADLSADPGPGGCEPKPPPCKTQPAHLSVRKAGILDEQWGAFWEAWCEFSELRPSSHDETVALLEWRRLDFEQRASASDWLGTAGENAKRGARRATPANFLGKRMFERREKSTGAAGGGESRYMEAVQGGYRGTLEQWEKENDNTRNRS